ncbi:MAG: NFACT RNA binding domain-containing protein [Gemmatimonadota bacterium]
MSNTIRYDAFLVDYLARELNHELNGKSVTALQFDSTDQLVLIDVDDIRLVWQLHAANGGLARTAPLYPLSDSAILPKRGRVAGVSALHDERVLMIELAGERKENATFRVVIELITNQWNAVALDHAGKVLRVLKLRETGRTFRRGQNYRPPKRPAPAADAETERTAYRSPLNESLTDEQFRSMLEQAPQPALLGGVQPYPHHLWQPDAQHFDSLLSAFAAASGDASGEALLRELERRLRASDKKIARLEAERAKAETAEQRTRANGALLLACASTVTRGVSRVTLPGFDGSDVEIELDPKLSAVDNAQALYEEARKQERALKRVPALIAEAANQRDRINALLERARQGELSDADLKQIAEKPITKPQQPYAERLPYRRYRTTGGLEVRVGRNAKSNDALTLQHSSPRDIWLHARHVGGAHVVLRWNDAAANPPLRDIMEAATLAAVHSGARTSRTVPVDYTRRKYIRKPRRSPPGTVVMERGKTVFVEPDADLEAKLRS